MSHILLMWLVHSSSPSPMGMRSSPVAHHGERVTTSSLAPLATWNGFSVQMWPCWPCCLLVSIFDNLQSLQLVGSRACGAGTCQCPPVTNTAKFQSSGNGKQGSRGCPPPSGTVPSLPSGLAWRSAKQYSD